jgi:hypothetical protein
VTCAQVAEDAHISLSDLTTWNPWVGNNCDSGLFAGLTGTQQRAVCIGVGSTGGGPSTTTPTPTSSTRTGTTTSTTTSAAPIKTQPGIVAGCTKYHVAQEGDGCWAVANQFGITLEQFYAWNPAGESLLSWRWLLAWWKVLWR